MISTKLEEGIKGELAVLRSSLGCSSGTTRASQFSVEDRTAVRHFFEKKTWKGM